ncbi:right-handed parallel beta-helix repeat-containing protein [Micromonospora coxensis]|uniref:right-handed parallel beta-helix repeat-containing protein n=1 Tax=Micromonospora coxensis TaxID=356852 RepID=UPI0012FE005E|nr:right-handed parallel beta-helix repeat-containing protein [Micromonospora coxensis]
MLNGKADIPTIVDQAGVFIAPQRRPARSPGSGHDPALDTRASGGTAFGAYATRQLDLSRKVPADATAAVLNVTVTAPTPAGVLRVFPAGSATPEASHLNFVAGQTIPNLVVVPVVAGRVSIHNAGSGSTHVVADLAGFYASTASGATDAYVPYGPTRIVDTRTDSGLIHRNGHGALEPAEDVMFRPNFLLLNCWDCPEPTGAVLNLTVTAPSAPGFLTAYPNATERPNASHVNFVARGTADNLAVVPTGQWRRIAAAKGVRRPRAPAPPRPAGAPATTTERSTRVGSSGAARIGGHRCTLPAHAQLDHGGTLMTTHNALARLALVPLAAGAVLVGPTAPAAVAAPAPTTATAPRAELYVSKTHCSPTGVQDGSPESPFCTIQAASAEAGPGQTVLVYPGTYHENVSFTRSGTPDAPITFRAVQMSDEPVRVGKYDTTAPMGAIMIVAGAHDVVIEGFTVYGESRADGVVVVDSSRVTLDQLTVHSRPDGASGVNVTGVSDDVTVSRSVISNTGGPTVDLDPGTTDVTVAGNQLLGSGLLATMSPGVSVTNNTVVTDCRVGIDLYSDSTNASVRNNIVRTSRTRQPCTAPAEAVAIRVAHNAVPATTVDHNLIDPAGDGPLYRWSGENHATVASFTTATGQGSHDLATDPRLVGTQTGWTSWYGPGTGSPARDSADATARGVLDSDLLDNPYADDPSAENTGTGSGYRDRGAVEAQGTPVTEAPYLRRKPGGGPLDVVAGASLRSSWPVERERTKYAYRFWGDRYWRVTDAGSLERSVRRAGRVCVDVRGTTTNFRTGSSYAASPCTVVGARFTPVTPTRLVDTRSGLGTGSAAPIGQNGALYYPVPTVAGVAAEDITALVLNVTVTRPEASGFITVSPDGTRLNASNVNFVAGETVANQVTVPVTGGRIVFIHTGIASVHLIADLQGVYTAAGSGYAPVPPVRMLDTREGAAGPVPAHTTRTLDLSAKLPAGATAAVLNVTVTKPTANGVLTLFPYGSAVPVASHLNFVTGQTIPNLVTVPVVGGKVSIRNASSGSTHVIADLAGWFSPDATQTFVPLTPTRLLDTRESGGALTARTAARVQPATAASSCAPAPACPEPTALVGNLTVTQPTAAGVLIAHPSAQARPTASNVNFVAGETASNAALVAVNFGVDVYNSSSGTAHVILDQSGYFIGPAA